MRSLIDHVSPLLARCRRREHSDVARRLGRSPLKLATSLPLTETSTSSPLAATRSVFFSFAPFLTTSSLLPLHRPFRLDLAVDDARHREVAVGRDHRLIVVAVVLDPEHQARVARRRIGRRLRQPDGGAGIDIVEHECPVPPERARTRRRIEHGFARGDVEPLILRPPGAILPCEGVLEENLAVGASGS